MIRIILTLFAALFTMQLAAKTRVVVGITIDGLRYDCLQLFWNGFGKGGFQKLDREGISVTTAQYDFNATDVAADVAAISTSAPAFINGIVASENYDRSTRKFKHALLDNSVEALGEDRSFSAAALLSPTFADRLFERNYGLSKVFSAAVSPEVAILQSGHCGSCYWINNLNGKWASSTYYVKKLPDWVEKYQDLGSYCSKRWSPLYPASYYASYRKGQMGFSYSLAEACNGLQFYENIATSPFANDFVCDFVLDAVNNEKIGADLITDVLLIGLSANPFYMKADQSFSLELEDAYLRLDKCIERILTTLDNKFGKDGYVVYVVGTRTKMDDLPPKPASKNLEWNEFRTDRYAALLNSYLKAIYGVEGLVEKFARGNIYLNHKSIESNKLNLKDVQKTSEEFMFMTNGVLEVATAYDLVAEACHGRMSALPFNRQVSGDVLYSLMPLYYEIDLNKKTTGYYANKNMPVPLFLYGGGITPETNCNIDNINKLGVWLEWLIGGNN